MGKASLQNFMKIGWELTKKSSKKKEIQVNLTASIDAKWSSAPESHPGYQTK